MAKARKILKHVKAIKNIRTVTNTMEMVATARFKKSHDRVVASRPFVDRLAKVVGDLVHRGGLDSISHPLLREPKDVKHDTMIVITSNRGLAGSYNSAVLRVALERYHQVRDGGYQVSLRAVGKRGINALKFRKLPLDRTYTQFDHTPPYDVVRDMADEIMDQFAQGKISGLEVAYMQFVSSGVQRPAIAQLLPLTDLVTERSRWVTEAKTGFELLPAGTEILDRLLPLTVRMKLYQCFLEAAVSEQVMRIAAMRSATDAADDMIHDLTVAYNRQRQSQITTELAEIMGGRGAVEE